MEHAGTRMKYKYPLGENNKQIKKQRDFNYFTFLFPLNQSVNVKKKIVLRNVRVMYKYDANGQRKLVRTASFHVSLDNV